MADEKSSEEKEQEKTAVELWRFRQTKLGKLLAQVGRMLSKKDRSERG